MVSKSDPIIKVKNIHKSFGKGEAKQVVIDGANLDIYPGESIAITGKSGSGKSTFMHAISGLDKADSGSVIVDGIDINKKKKNLNKFRNKTIGFVFQSFYLNQHDTVLENVLLPSEIGGDVNLEKAKEVIKSVELEDFINKKAKQLSGGQKQRVAIARALVNEPKIIFADEPTGNLDEGTSKVIEDLLFTIQKKSKITLIIVTHDPELAKKCSRIIVIKNGKVA